MKKELDVLGRLGALELVAAQFSQKLGMPSAPSVKLREGPRCSVSRKENTIFLGESILHQLSAGACCAILAHEVAHLAQEDLPPYFPTRLVGASCALSSLALGLALANVSVAGSAALSLSATGILFFAARYANARQTRARLQREIDADRVAADLVSRDVMLKALTEYVNIFNENAWCQQSAYRSMKLLELQSRPAQLSQL